MRTNTFNKLVKLSRGVPFVLATAAIVAAGAPQAWAQGTGPRQGSNGVFAGGKSDASARQRLDLTLSSTEAYDRDQVPDGVISVGSSGPESTGYSTMFMGAADYSLQVRRVQFRATGTSALRYNRPLADALYSSFRSLSHTAGVGLFAQLPKKTSVLVNQTAVYSPSYLYNLFPQAPANVGDAPPGAPDYAVGGFESHTYGTVTTLTHDFTPRSIVVATGDYQRTDTAGGTDGRRELGSYGIRGQFSHRLGRSTAALGEYMYRNSEFQRAGEVGIGGTLVEHSVSVGAEYNRRLSASRRLTFGALVGSSMSILPELSITASPDPSIGTTPESIEGSDGSNRSYRRMSGQVTLGYEFARSWKLGAIYRRGVDNVAGLGEPITADRFSTSVSGLLTRRVDVLATAGYSNGTSAVNRQSSAFDTYTGDVTLRYALTRTFAAYVEYLYYFYDSRGTTPIAPGISSRLERKGARAGLTLRVPALGR